MRTGLVVLCIFLKICQGEANDEALHEIPGDELEETEEITMSYYRSDFYGPNHWGKISKFCDGFHQSPVNLYIDQARKLYGLPLIIDGIDDVPSSITITNSGHSVSIKFGFYDGNPIQLSGGPLAATYIADNIHFHWGESDLAGSEHTINAKRYSAELHLVTYNSHYGSLADAVQQPDGLAVLGFVYELHSDNETSNPIVSLLSQVIEPKATYVETQNVFTLRDLIKTDNFDYLSYNGSLTTPNCYESVTWLVSLSFLSISSEDLAALREIHDEKHEKLVKNYRPLQKLNRRPVDLHQTVRTFDGFNNDV